MDNEKNTVNEEQLSSPEGFQIIDQKDGRTRLRVQFDITYKGHPGKEVEGESQTEPDMTLRIGQLLERHSRGKDVPMKTPIYFDTEVPTFNDLTDVEKYRDQLIRRTTEVNTFIDNELQESKAKKEEATKKAKAAQKTQHSKAQGQQLGIEDDPSYIPKE